MLIESIPLAVLFVLIVFALGFLLCYTIARKFYARFSNMALSTIVSQQLELAKLLSVNKRLKAKLEDLTQSNEETQ